MRSHVLRFFALLLICSVAGCSRSAVDRPQPSRHPAHVASVAASAAPAETPPPLDPPGARTVDVYSLIVKEPSSGLYLEAGESGPSVSRDFPKNDFADLFMQGTNWRCHHVRQAAWMGSHLYSSQTAVLDVGPVDGLCDIKAAPASGYEAAAPIRLHQGYIVRCIAHDGKRQTFARLRVTDWIRDKAGGIAGCKVRFSVQADGARIFTQ